MTRAPPPVPMTPERVQALIQTDTYQVTCSGCGHRHRFSDRKVDETLTIRCPKCADQAYKLVG